MTDLTALESRSGGAGLPADTSTPAVAVDTRRRLQLVLAGLWLLDGVLQLQPFMFTKSFAWMTLGPAADEGGPGWVTGPMHWLVNTVWQHPVSTNAAFALIQLALGIGIAYRPTLRPALAVSIAWSLGVWWLGEGFGGLFAGSANPLSGGPGAVIFYALIAVLLWPTGSGSASATTAPYQAAAKIGARAARIVWVAVWGLLAVLALLPQNRDPGAAQDAINDSNAGAPSGLVWLDNRVADLVAGKGLTVAIVLAVLFALVAVSVLLPWRRAVVAGLVLAFTLAAVIWVFGQGFGMPFQGMATDPNSAPLLALLAAVYWPRRAPIPAEVPA
ncbi:MAG TPA: hypothetical protein VFU73_05715 [Actinocrinis sp.]|nr:hypothetical protein [Actinocrinis sp.]